MSYGLSSLKSIHITSPPHRKDTICIGLIMSYGLSSLKSMHITSPPHRKDTICIGLIMSYGVSLLPLCDDDRADSDLQMGGVLWFDVFRPYYGLMFVVHTMV
jgi:hypothetical protein